MHLYYHDYLHAILILNDSDFVFPYDQMWFLWQPNIHGLL